MSGYTLYLRESRESGLAYVEGLSGNVFATFENIDIARTYLAEVGATWVGESGHQTRVLRHHYHFPREVGFAHETLSATWYRLPILPHMSKAVLLLVSQKDDIMRYPRRTLAMGHYYEAHLSQHPGFHWGNMWANRAGDVFTRSQTGPQVWVEMPIRLLAWAVVTLPNINEEYTDGR